MTKLVLVKGDITTQSVDAIVNAANRSLMGGGGVDGAIHRAAGPKLREECLTLGGCKTGEAKITSAYKLPAKFVIHTVGPEYGREKGMEDELLSLCYLTSLQLAEMNGLRTIALPAISTGAFRYPLDEATEIAVSSVRHYIEGHPDAFDEIRFVVTKDDAYEIYHRLLD
jgi:O-acetyl-ADP-ribose deacetylase